MSFSFSDAESFLCHVCMGLMLSRVLVSSQYFDPFVFCFLVPHIRAAGFSIIWLTYLLEIIPTKSCLHWK